MKIVKNGKIAKLTVLQAASERTAQLVCHYLVHRGWFMETGAQRLSIRHAEKNEAEKIKLILKRNVPSLGFLRASNLELLRAKNVTALS